MDEVVLQGMLSHCSCSEANSLRPGENKRYWE